jgi:catechol 2,3-dioxygenase-like lactoylglutathione lyase family enzyme
MMVRMSGRLHGVVIDCPDPDAIAAFYQQLLGLVRVQDEGHWVVIGDAPDRPGLAFQRIDNYRAPTWPDPEVPQQIHLDVKVDDLDAGEAEALALGATRLPAGGETFRVFSDPIGHPFCLVTFPPWSPDDVIAG